jgi:4-aminobutyrate aminotransferase/(S)-3-amino-2-methylpropionate transaminase
MGQEFDITPKNVPRVETKYRRIATRLPHPDSVPVLEKLRQCEPVSMRGQPPLVWDRAEDIFVYDKYGNRWLDWSSGVLVANAGHAAPEIRQAILDQVNRPLLHNYVFPSAERARLAEYLLRLAPAELDKVFFLTTGSEAVECALKLARARGLKIGGPRKIGLVGAERGFHGRTLGAQQAGGIPGQKNGSSTRTRPSCRSRSRTVIGRRTRASICFWKRSRKRACSGQRGGRHLGDLPGSRAGFRAQRVCPGPGPMVPEERCRFDS